MSRRVLGSAGSLSLVTIILVLFLAGVPGGAEATDCAALGGVGVAPADCVVSAVVTVAPGTYNLSRTLRITGTGRIDVSNDVALDPGITINVCVPPAPAGTCDLIIEPGGSIDASDDAAGADPNEPNDNAKPITLNVSRDVILEGAGSSITAENKTQGGDGGAITIDAGRNVDLGTGALISSSKTSTGGNGNAGNILITAGPPPQSAVGDVTIAEGATIKANNATQKAGKIEIIAGHSITVDGNVLSQGVGDNPATGGPIFLITCFLEVGDAGVVSSRGDDPGADLVSLQGCIVIIRGLVESTGEAHGSGTGRFCKESPRGPAHVQQNRPGFTNWTACVEIIAGSTVLIDGLNANGQVNADTATTGGGGGGAWIDIFANGAITILGGAGTFAVHANQNFNPGDQGGLIQVKSLLSSVTASGNALQADANVNGGQDGGEIIVHANTDVTLNGATISAQGDNNPAGGFGNGGDIFVQSFNQAINWTSGTANVLPTGTNVPAANDGTLTLTACTAVNTGFTFPTNGAAEAGNPAVTTGTCGGAPTVPAYVTTLGLLQPADCVARCGDSPGGGNGDCTKSSIRSILDPVTGRFPGNTGPDQVVKVHPPSSQLIQPAVTGATDTNGDGYIIILVVAKDGGLFGGSTTQNVVISDNYPDPFGLLACSVTLNALSPGQATGRITSAADAPFPPAPATGNIFVMDLHATGSSVAGWLVEGDDRYMRNINVLDNNAVGMKIDGNGNTVHNGLAEGNLGGGYLVEGDNNTLTGVKAFDNLGQGIQITGTGNTVVKSDVGDRGKGNTAGGIQVEGQGNTLSEVDVFANLGWGISLVGNSNQLKKNNVGDRGKGNVGGIRVDGDSNSLTENDAYANTGDGFSILGNSNLLKLNRAGDTGKGNTGDGYRFEGSSNVADGNRANANGGDGFDFALAGGTNNVLKSNRSNEGGNGGNRENGGCEYTFAEGTTLDAGSNKKDNANFVGVGAPKRYPAGCYE